MGEQAFEKAQEIIANDDNGGEDYVDDYSQNDVAMICRAYLASQSRIAQLEAVVDVAVDAVSWVPGCDESQRELTRLMNVLTNAGFYPRPASAAQADDEGEVGGA